MEIVLLVAFCLLMEALFTGVRDGAGLGGPAQAHRAVPPGRPGRRPGDRPPVEAGARPRHHPHGDERLRGPLLGGRHLAAPAPIRGIRIARRRPAGHPARHRPRRGRPEDLRAAPGGPARLRGRADHPHRGNFPVSAGRGGLLGGADAFGSVRRDSADAGARYPGGAFAAAAGEPGRRVGRRAPRADDGAAGVPLRREEGGGCVPPPRAGDGAPRGRHLPGRRAVIRPERVFPLSRVPGAGRPGGRIPPCPRRRRGSIPAPPWRRCCGSPSSSPS